MKNAEFAPRAIAYVVDMVLTTILIFIVMLSFGLIIGMASKGGSGFSSFIAGTTAIVMFVVLFFLHFLYFGYLWSKNGQSLGMKLQKIKVVRRNGEELSFLRAALRGTVGYSLSSVVFYLGYLWAAFDADGETWHDKIFDTRVISL